MHTFEPERYVVGVIDIPEGFYARERIGGGRVSIDNIRQIGIIIDVGRDGLMLERRAAVIYR